MAPYVAADAVMAALVRVVSPYVGETMARSAVQAHGEKLGFNGPDVTPEQVDALIARLGSGLNVFLGREKSGLVVSELKKVVAVLR